MGKVGVDTSQMHSTKARLEGLRQISRSKTWCGNCHIPPRDGSLRQHFAAIRLLTNSKAPQDEVFDAMKLFARRNGLRRIKTYHGVAWQCNLDLNRDCPRRRS